MHHASHIVVKQDRAPGCTSLQLACTLVICLVMHLPEHDAIRELLFLHSCSALTQSRGTQVLCLFTLKIMVKPSFLSFSLRGLIRLVRVTRNTPPLLKLVLQKSVILKLIYCISKFICIFWKTSKAGANVWFLTSFCRYISHKSDLSSF